VGGAEDLNTKSNGATKKTDSTKNTMHLDPPLPLKLNDSNMNEEQSNISDLTLACRVYLGSQQPQTPSPCDQTVEEMINKMVLWIKTKNVFRNVFIHLESCGNKGSVDLSQVFRSLLFGSCAYASK
jgi:hypothetical protein